MKRLFKNSLVKFFVSVIAAVLLMGGSLAYSQQPDCTNSPEGCGISTPAVTTPSTGSTPSTSPRGMVDTAVNALSSMVNGVEQSMNGWATSAGAKSIGVQLLAFFVAANVIWAILKGIATGRMLDYMIGELLPIGVAAVVAYMFLGEISGVQNLTTSIQQFVSYIGSTVTGTSMPSETGTGTLWPIMKGLVQSGFSIVVDIFDIKVQSSVSSVFQVNVIGAAVGWAVSWVLKILVVVASAIIVIAMIGAIIATLLLSQVGVLIALAFAPIFIPFMIFQPLESFFSKWLEFFVGSLFAKVIGLMVLKITEQIMLSAKGVAAKLPPPDAAIDAFVADVVIYLSIIVLLMVCYTLVSRIEPIAKALAGGAMAQWKGFGREFHGGMGGIGQREPTKGGAGAGPTSLNAASAITTVMPNYVKPFTSAAGNFASSVAGRRAARSDVAAQARNMEPGGSGLNVVRDVSRNSQRYQQAYNATKTRAATQTPPTSTGTTTGAGATPNTASTGKSNSPGLAAPSTSPGQTGSNP